MRGFLLPERKVNTPESPLDFSKKPLTPFYYTSIFINIYNKKCRRINVIERQNLPSIYLKIVGFLKFKLHKIKKFLFSENK